MVNPQHQILIKIANKELQEIHTAGFGCPRYIIDPIDGFIASGSFGKVFMGYDIQNGNRKVAIKINDQGSLESDEISTKEAGILKQHPHENLVIIYDCHKTSSGKLVLVIEYVPFTLENALGLKDFDLERTIEFVDPVCKAVDHLHEIKNEQGEPIVHRDIKPANILISEKGAVKLSDLGSANYTNMVSTADGAMIYRAPEGFAQEGRRFYPESDLYSIAVVAFEALAGKNPFVASEESVVLRLKKDPDYIKQKCRESGFDKRLTRAMLKALNLNHTQRYKSGKNFTRALKRL